MPKTIRVVCVGPALTVQGGMSRVIGMIQKHLPDHIHYRHVATFTEYTGADETLPSDRGSKLFQSFVYLWAFSRILVSALRRNAVFHIHFSNGGSVLRKGLICIVLRVLRCQYVVHAHAADADLFHPWLPARIRRALLWGIGGAGRLIALTQHWSAHYYSMFPSSSSSPLLLPNPSDPPASIPDRSRRQRLKLLFLGRIGMRKGAFDVIRAFAGLPHDLRQRCDLTLAGDGDVNAARQLSAELGCSDRVSIPGWVDDSEVNRLMEESDVLALPSRAEGMAMALVEGMSWGLAVIASGVGGASEFLEHGSNCMLVTPGDVDEIREAISELVRDSALRLRLGLSARETVSRFSIETYIGTLTRLYEELSANLPGNRSTQIDSRCATQESIGQMSRCTSAFEPKK